MAKQPKDKKEKKDEKEPLLQPDPETLHKTDPQENMEGPVSSVVQAIKEEAEENEERDKEDKKKKD
ncbi:hypothetical protein [Terrimonas pollutisoli]|uniref:hypothetical protein n=1 Tax=Terrimonas pollutisoli TaxID=3034147 RepID=UPI0023EC3B4A|nr:hypothetical protein [Terrimonas sp. H1YJ31]